MELLARITARRLAVAALVFLALKLLAQHSEYPLNMYRRWMYPPQGQASAAGQEILAANEKREAARVEARYRRVLAMLQQARSEGHDTSGLEAKAGAALSLNVAAYRRKAVKMLTEVEMAAPRRRVRYIDMGPTQAPGEEIEPDAPARPVVEEAEEEQPRPKPKPKSRRKRSRR